MTPLHKTILVFLFTTMMFCAGATLAQETKVKDQELNFALTQKREIKSDDGIIYKTEEDLKTITAFAGNKIIWTVDVIKICGNPSVGAPKIRYLKLSKDEINVVFGKHSFASIDVRNGKITCKGAD